MMPRELVLTSFLIDLWREFHNCDIQNVALLVTSDQGDFWA